MKITHGGIEIADEEGRMERRAIAVMESRAQSNQAQSGRTRFGRGPSGRALFRAAFRTALAFTVFFSLYPHDAVQETFSEETQTFDWLFHSLCYATLSVTWLLGRARRPRGILPRLDAALAFTSLGCALELAQALLPFVARTCTLSDAAANALGALLGALLVPLPGKATDDTSSGLAAPSGVC